MTTEKSDRVMVPSHFALLSPVTIGLPPELMRPSPKATQAVKTLTVANGAVIKVYDVGDPTNPVLLKTIG